MMGANGEPTTRPLRVESRLLSGGLWATGARVAFVLVNLGVCAILTRLLPQREAGAYFFAVVVAELGAIVGSLGFNRALVRFVAENNALGRPLETRRSITLALRLTAVGATLAGGLCLCVGGLIPGGMVSPALLGGWVAAMAFSLVLSEAFRGFHRMLLACAMQGLLAGGLLLVCLWALQASGAGSLDSVLWARMLSGIAGVGVGAALLYRQLGKLHVPPAPTTDERGLSTRSVLRITLPLLLASVLQYLSTRADMWVLRGFRSAEEIALYGAAMRLAALTAFPLLIANAVVPPMIAELHALRRTRRLQRAVRATTAACAVPATGALLLFLLFGRAILRLVYGTSAGDYGDGAAILSVLALANAVHVWLGPCRLTLAMTGHQTIMMLLTLVCAMMTVGAAVLLALAHGAIGVALAAGGGLILLKVSLFVAVRVRLGIWIHVGPRDLLGLSRRLIRNARRRSTRT
jgi:O-antigen/teichoic acid export membrane protein